MENVAIDKSAVPANEIHVKLRHGETNAKLKRTPYNLESAIVSMFGELVDLNGPETAYDLFARLADIVAAEKGWDADNADRSATAAIIECAVNRPDVDAKTVAAWILAELSDMELIA